MEIRLYTGEVMTDTTFRTRFGDRVLPAQLTQEWLTGFGADVVLEGPQPSTENRYQFVFRDGVEQIDGKWFTKYSIGEPDDEGKAEADTNRAAQVRSDRDRRLGETVDRINAIRWETMTEEQKSAWRTFRQAMLDVPAQSGFPWDVEWPATPA